MTGSSGVATASTKPSSPAIVATHRAILTSPVILFGSLARSLTFTAEAGVLLFSSFTAEAGVLLFSSFTAEAALLPFSSFTAGP
jgi:hypothetical protein